MRMMLLLLTVLLGGCGELQYVSAKRSSSPTCVSVADVASQVVKIYNEDVTASAVLTKPNELLTVRHVGDQLGVSRNWREVQIEQQDLVSKKDMRLALRKVRLKQVLQGGDSEDLHVLELSAPLDWNPRPVMVRRAPLHHGDLLRGIGYTDGAFASSFGTFRSDGPVTDAYNDYVRFEVVYESGKIALGPGASGGGIFDCEGRLVGVHSASATWERGLLERIIFGAFNMYAVPISPAREMFH